MTADVPVLIVGAGPVGLCLAIELGWRGVPCVVVEQQAEDALNFPTANNISTRTMEHLRRWGLAERVRGVAADLPYGRLWVSSIGGQEIARFEYPPNRDACPPPFSPETFVWCPKPYFDPLLLGFARSFPDVEVRHGWRFVSFEQGDDGVVTHLESEGQAVEVRAQFLVGCDGASSAVRRQAGFERVGKFSDREDLRGVSVYFRAPALAGRLPFVPAHCFVLSPRLNRHGAAALLVAIDGRTTWRTSFERRPGEVSLDAVERLREVLGADVEFEVLDTWRGALDHRAVNRHYRLGQVFVAGDAAHISTPRGGLGANTGMQDAVDLGWKLAAELQGWAGPYLLDSYELERRPQAIRLLRFQGVDAGVDPAVEVPTDVADLPLTLPVELDVSGPKGEDARRRIGRDVWRVHQTLFTHPGLDLGFRYEGSPIVVPDGTPAPLETVATYVQTARPGSRAPHAWLRPGRSTLDLFGRGFTLVRIGGPVHDTRELERAAVSLGVPLDVADVHLPEILHLYERPLALVRPDGFVAWRGEEVPADVDGLLDRVRGA